MSEDRWVRIVDPEHVYRAATDEVWHPVHYPQRWCPVDGLADGKCDVRSLYKVRCRLRDVPPGTQIVDPGPEHELVEPWERDPAGITEYWGISTQSWRLRPYPRNTLTHDDIYRRPIRVIYPDQFAATTAAFRKAMEVSKTPQPGEWWFANYMSERLFFHGRNQHGHLFFESKSGCTSAISKDDWSDWHHEPDCTGWDWQPPQKQAEPLTLTLEQRVESLEERLKKLEHQVSELEDCQ